MLVAAALIMTNKTMKKKFFIVLAMMIAVAQGAWADSTKSFPLHYDKDTNPEDGSAEHPYQILSVDDLNTLATDVNSGTTYEGYNGGDGVSLGQKIVRLLSQAIAPNVVQNYDHYEKIL